MSIKTSKTGNLVSSFFKWLFEPFTNDESTHLTAGDDQTLNDATRVVKLTVRLNIFIGVSAIGFLLSSMYITMAKNAVVAIPMGDIWEYPMVHWINNPNRYEEDAKPIHVALQYIHGIFEVDPLDFSSPDPLTPTLTQMKMSDKIANLLSYTIPGTDEHRKVQEALDKSQSVYQMFSGCQCVKRFLVTDVMVSLPPLPMLRVEVLGRFVIFGQDGRRPVAAEDLGYKSIVLYLNHDSTIIDRKQRDVADDVTGTKILNQEGWFVVRSNMTTLNKEDIDDVRKIRAELGMKGTL